MMEQFKSEILITGFSLKNGDNVVLLYKDILKGLEHISAQIAEMNTPQPDYTKLIEDCDHSRYWQSEVDGHKSMNKCIICGFQWSGKVIKR
jgi:hypothetical protein